MFRNSYLDTYKHAVLYNKEVQILFVHLSQIYTTLGSVINDIQYQFGLILSQNNQAERNNRNNIKSSYGSKLPQSDHKIKDSFNELQNKLENFSYNEMKKLPQLMLQYNPPVPQKEPTKVKIQLIESSERRNSRQAYVPLIQSTQDFDALFLNPKDEIINQNSSSRPFPKQKNKSEDSAGEKTQKTNTNKLSEDEANDFMDKLFRN